MRSADARSGPALPAIYVKRGLDEALASRVATQLTQHDALGAHGRDELGLSDALAARAGGAPITVLVTRVTFWGALAMGLTAGVGAMFGVAA